MSTKVRVNLREIYPKYYNQDCFVEVDRKRQMVSASLQ